jgi:hypothetical protein
MTRTEDRLADALGAVARGVKEETLPPLPARSPSPGRQRWGRWLAPAAAAASVALIVVLVSAVHLFSGKPGGAAHPAGPPRYYAAVEHQGIVIRDTATGAVTGTIPNKKPGSGSYGDYAASIAATAGGREFIAAYIRTVLGTDQQETRLFSFRLTSAGKVTGFALVRGGVINGLLAGYDMAISPDGSKVALVLYRPLSPAGRVGVPHAEIVVINLRTGTRGLWQGGLMRSGLTLHSPSISWEPDGRSLVFLALWCREGIVGSGYCTAGRHYAQVRTLSLAAGGGLLSQGSVLLSQSARYPYLVQALLSPGGNSLTVVGLRGPYAGKVFPVPQHLQVIQVPLAKGGRPRLLYHGVTGGYIDAFLGSDASGRYLLLDWRANGWLDHGVLRPLAPQGDVAFEEAW